MTSEPCRVNLSGGRRSRKLFKFHYACEIDRHVAVVLCELGLLTSNLSRSLHPLRTSRLAPVLVASFVVKLASVLDGL
jgi:hypothetical protein